MNLSNPENIKPSQNHHRSHCNHSHPAVVFLFISNTPLRQPQAVELGSQDVVLHTMIQIQNCSSFLASGKSPMGRVHLHWPERDGTGLRHLIFCPLVCDQTFAPWMCCYSCVLPGLEIHGYKQRFSQSHSLKVYRPIYMEVFEVLCAAFHGLQVWKCLKGRINPGIT